MLDAIRALALMPIMYLLTMYVLWENGPFRVFDRLRTWGGVIQVPTIDGDVSRQSNGTLLADILTCWRCLSPYAAALVVILAVICRWIAWPIGHLVILWLCLAGLNVFVYERFYA